MLSRRHPRWHRSCLARRPFAPSDPPTSTLLHPGRPYRDAKSAASIPTTFFSSFYLLLSAFYLLFLSPLECAVPGTRPATPLECAVTKIGSGKSFRMHSSEKRWGGTPVALLRRGRRIRDSRRGQVKKKGGRPEACAPGLARRLDVARGGGYLCAAPEWVMRAMKSRRLSATEEPK